MYNKRGTIQGLVMIKINGVYTYLLSWSLFFLGEGAEMTEGGSQGTQPPSIIEPNVEKYCRDLHKVTRNKTILMSTWMSANPPCILKCAVFVHK